MMYGKTGNNQLEQKWIISVFITRQYTSVSSTSTSTNYWPTSTVWRLCQGNCVAKKGKKSNKKKISLEICTKQGVNLEIRSGNGSPEWLDWVTQHCKSEVDSLSPPIIMSRWETTNKTHFLTLYIPVICIGLFFQMNDSMDDSTWTGNNRFCF
jgi:hypothetical protein